LAALIVADEPNLWAAFGVVDFLPSLNGGAGHIPDEGDPVRAIHLRSQSLD
jgi:hypothetical protein